MNQKGQALTELTFLTCAVFFVSAGVAKLLWLHWKRTECSYLVFETTHAHVTGRPKHKGSTQVHLQPLSQTQGIQGTAECGQHTEIVQLPELEAAQWK